VHLVVGRSAFGVGGGYALEGVLDFGALALGDVLDRALALGLGPGGVDRDGFQFAKGGEGVQAGGLRNGVERGGVYGVGSGGLAAGEEGLEGLLAAGGGLVLGEGFGAGFEDFLRGGGLLGWGSPSSLARDSALVSRTSFAVAACWAGGALVLFCSAGW